MIKRVLINQESKPFTPCPFQHWLLLYPNLQPTLFLSEKQLFELGTLKFLCRLTLSSYTEFSTSHLPSGFSLTLSNLEQVLGRRNGTIADEDPRSVCEESFCPKHSPPSQVPAYLWNPRWRHSYEKCELIWTHGGRPAPVLQPDHFPHTTEW